MQYKSGTVSVTNGSNIVSGFGTTWLANVQPGQGFKIAGDDSVYTVAAVSADYQLQLSAPYEGATASDQQYQITRDYTPNFKLAEINTNDQDWPVHLTQQVIRRIDAILAGILGITPEVFFDTYLAGVPTADTAPTVTNSTQLATTAFVQANLVTKAPLSNAQFTTDIMVQDITLGYGNYQNNGNLACGLGALGNNLSGAGDTAIGYNSLSELTTYVGCTGLGYGSQVTGSCQVQLGDSQSIVYTYAPVQVRSDVRDKADITDTNLGLSFILKLRPVQYRWDMREDYKPARPNSDTATDADIAEWIKSCDLSNILHDGTKKRTRLHQGIIAQELKLVMDSLGMDFGGYQDHSINGGQDVLSIGYEEFIPPLIKAVQELAAKNSEFETRLLALENK